MISRHFQANMKVQTAMCKDNNNSKSRAATYVKFDIYIYVYNDISRLYLVYKIYSIFHISVKFQDIKFHQS